MSQVQGNQFDKDVHRNVEDNGRIAQGSIKYRGQELTDLKSNKDWENIRGSKIATIFQDPMTSLDPINTIGSKLQKSLSNTKENS